jgi:hypothetical protein
MQHKVHLKPGRNIIVLRVKPERAPWHASPWSMAAKRMHYVHPHVMHSPQQVALA